MRIKEQDRSAGNPATQTMLTAGGLLAALAASSCCILPLVLFSLGVSGAWIGNLTRLAPYQPYFIAGAVALLASGFWLVYRPPKAACGEGEACARPLPNKLVKSGLIFATVLVVADLAFNFAAPLLLDN